MGLGTYYQNPTLNFLLGGATATVPSKWALCLCSTAPTDASLVEFATGIGYTVQTMPFPAVPGGTTGSVSNTTAATFGPWSSTETISGAGIKDTSATGGNQIFVGSLSAAATMTPGESLIFAVGSLACSVA